MAFYLNIISTDKSSKNPAISYHNLSKHKRKPALPKEIPPNWDIFQDFLQNGHVKINRSQIGWKRANSVKFLNRMCFLARSDTEMRGDHVLHKEDEDYLWTVGGHFKEEYRDYHKI